ncbi:MAG: prepilin-type N-terminal cleavage/methylation domain-containing protein [bacterium]
MASGNKTNAPPNGCSVGLPRPAGKPICPVTDSFPPIAKRIGGKRTLHHACAFTLIELIAVMAAIAILLSLLLPALAKSVEVGRRAVCVNNLKNLQAAYLLYLSDHEGKLFGWKDGSKDGKTLLYYGLSSDNGEEGRRSIDMSHAKLAPYLGSGGGVEVCPAMPYRASYFKKKYEIATYGYGININLLTNFTATKPSRITVFGAIERPSETIVWGDAVQINQFQPPASPSNPMLEEWSYLDRSIGDQHYYHFRHNRRVNVIFADGSVKSMPPDRLDKRCDGLVGALEPGTEDYWLRTRK